VVQTASPIDGNVALLAIETRGTLHAATGANSAELEQAVKDRAVVADVVFALLSHK